MISTYDDYLPMSMSLSLEEMASLHNDMVKEIGNDSDSLELFEELITTATRYMVFRSNWLLWSKEKKWTRIPAGLPAITPDRQIQPACQVSEIPGQGCRLA